ncbi:MAG: DUF1499 domain-containing protein [Rhodothermales bacterium]
MKGVLKVVGVLAIGAIGFAATSRWLTTDRADFPSDPGSPDNPLPACPNAPNCVRVTWLYPQDPTTVRTAAISALQDTGAASYAGADNRLEAVYNAFVFQDDVTVVIEPHDGGSALHLRSSSRVGHSDLGVNGQRVEALREALDERLR